MSMEVNQRGMGGIVVGFVRVEKKKPGAMRGVTADAGKRIVVSECVDLNSIILPGFPLVVGSPSICGHIYESYLEAPPC